MTTQIEVDERLSKHALRFLETKPEDRVSPAKSKPVQAILNVVASFLLAALVIFVISEGLKRTNGVLGEETVIEAYRFSFIGGLFGLFLVFVFPLNRYQEVPQGCMGLPYFFGFIPMMGWQLAPGKHASTLLWTIHVCKLGGETFDVKDIPGVMSPTEGGGSTELEVSSSGQTILIDPVEAISLFGQGGPAGIARNMYDAFSWLVRNALSAIPLDTAELGGKRDAAVWNKFRAKEQDPETHKSRAKSIQLPGTDNRVLYVEKTGYAVDELRVQESMPKDKAIRDERAKLAPLAIKLKALTMTREATKDMQNADFMVAAILDFVRDEKMEMKMFEVGPNLGSFLERLGLDKDSAVAIADKAAEALKGIGGGKAKSGGSAKASGGTKKK